ncbi:MAG: sensor histidine kinase [Verrucomicrobiae bacterium]|nr:sensor histidine kinase [Verrucomicrobiae bacterium]
MADNSSDDRRPEAPPASSAGQMPDFADPTPPRSARRRPPARRGTAAPDYDGPRSEPAPRPAVEFVDPVHGAPAQEEERRRIGKELHDSTAQEIAAVVMNLNALQQRLQGGDKEAQTLVGDSLAILENSARDVRTLSHLLHPPFLEEVGLIGALRQYIAGFSQRSGIRVETELPESWARLSGDTETALFRVVQEALGNIHRHSASPSAAVRLRRANGTITLEIADQGRGLARAADTEGDLVVGVGIAGMRERMRQIGGTLEIETADKGTIVRAVLPAPTKDG